MGKRLKERSEHAARDAVQALVRRHDLRTTFSDAVFQEVAKWQQDPSLGAADLVDLRELPFVTIDDARTRDLDQAVEVTLVEKGTYLVRYALADASYFCPMGSALFAEAMERGASYYLPGVTVPMLPKELSEGLVSLNPGGHRRALIIEMTFVGADLVVGDVYQAFMRSEAKLSFEEVQDLYDTGACPPCSDAARSSLECLRDLGEVLLEARKRRGVPQYRRQELDVRVSECGRNFRVEGRERLAIERYNEEISLHCNTYGARWLAHGDTPTDGVEPVFRVHQAPDNSRLDRFERLTKAAVQERGPEASGLGWRRAEGESLAEYLDRLPTEGPLEPWARALHRQAIMVNHRSLFSSSAGPHFGIGAQSYARFSSPMRELVGVFVHKEALERLAMQRGETPTQDQDLRDDVIERANRAKSLQKQLTKDSIGLVIDSICRRDHENGSPLRSGILMGFTKTRLHVLLEAPPVDIKIYFRYFEGAEIVSRDAGVDIIQGDRRRTLRLGDTVRTYVRSYDEKKQRWVFGLE